MRKGGGKAKGSKFEGDMCRLLSLWWTKGKEDDVFWKTHGSGNRATIRSKTGKNTRGQYGDVAAVDSRGHLLTKLCTISLKCGYEGEDLLDLLEVGTLNGEPEYAEWIRDAERDMKGAKSLGWMIIHKKNRMQPVVFMPDDLWHELYQFNYRIARVSIFTQVHVNKKKYKITEIRKLLAKKKKLKRTKHMIYGVQLQAFLKMFTKKDIKTIYKRNK
jgi:hypothetical protein